MFVVVVFFLVHAYNANEAGRKAEGNWALELLGTCFLLLEEYCGGPAASSGKGKTYISVTATAKKKKGDFLGKGA